MNQGNSLVDTPDESQYCPLCQKKLSDKEVEESICQKCYSDSLDGRV